MKHPALTDLLDLSALRQLEQAAEHAGLPLMQRAAGAITACARQHIPAGSRILVAAGPGNNGGDALLAARQLLAAGYAVEVLLPQAPASPATQAALAAWQAADGLVRPSLGDAKPDWLLDGLFGVGLSRPLHGAWLRLIRQLDEQPCRRLAIDIPSGLHAYTGQPQGAAIRADLTLALLGAKPGLFTGQGRDYSGKVVMDTLDCPPGLFPPAVGSIACPSVRPLLRRHASHKGSYGTISIVGGANGMGGAAILAGRAALALGAGKVFVHAQSPLPLDPHAPELMLRSWQDSLHIPASHVLLLGTGLGLSDDAHALMAKLLLHDNTLILDADALNLLAADQLLQEKLRQRRYPTLLTPHPTEAARLLDSDTDAIQQDRLAAWQQLCTRYACNVLLKGSGTILGNAGQPYRLLTRGSPALAVAGQGDLLGGAISALLAQGMPLLDAAHLAAELHATAGEQYEQATGGPIGLSATTTLQLMTRELNLRLKQAGAPVF